MRISSPVVIAACVLGLACSADPAEVDRAAASPVGVSEEALNSGGWLPSWSALRVNANGFAGSPAAVRLTDNTIEVIARDAVTNTLLRSRKVAYSGAWQPWTSLGADVFTGKPAAVGLDEDFPGSGRYVVFARKSNGLIYARYLRVNGDPLTSWSPISNNSFVSSPAAAIAGGVLWVVARKSDGRLYAAAQVLKRSGEPFAIPGFGAFQQLPAAPGSSFVGDPAVSGASFWESGGPAFYSRLGNNTFVTDVVSTDSSHSGWRAVGAQTFGSDPSVTSSFRVQRTTIFGRQLSGSGANRVTQSTGFFQTWQAYSAVKGDTFVDGPAAVDGTYSYGGPGEVGLVHHVVAKRSNNQLYFISHTNTDPNGGPRVACEDVKRLRQKLPHVKAVLLPPAGEVVLSKSDSLIASDLRGIALDDAPPVLGAPNPPQTAAMADDAPPGQAPFLTGIGPFRHEWFNNEFMIGGWHTHGAVDYASTQGFGSLINYNRKLAEQGHLPSGTQWAQLVNWGTWMARLGINRGLWHELADVDLFARLSAEGFPALPGGTPPPESVLVLDIEEGAKTLEDLRDEPFYPAGGTPAEKAEFEADYYRGYTKMYTAAVDAARARGYPYVSIYGWSPFPRIYWGLETASAEPATDFAWNTYGKEIYAHVDGINNSVYNFYWGRDHIAYTLANIWLNQRMTRLEPVQKPIRPYFWNQLHGGGGGWRWWRNLPIPNEEARALTAISYFAGIDGIVHWDWSGTGNFSIPSPLPATIGPEVDVMVGKPFALAPVSPAGAPAFAFKRYDALHIVSAADGVVQFQRIDQSVTSPPYGTGAGKPTYALPTARLMSYLRPMSEPLSGVFEGTALVKPFEYTLRNGRIMLDFTPQYLFALKLPILRRTKQHGVHVVISNSPAATYGDPQEEIELNSFDGRSGRTLRVPADAETRIWVLVDSPCN